MNRTAAHAAALSMFMEAAEDDQLDHLRRVDEMFGRAQAPEPGRSWPSNDQAQQRPTPQAS